MRDWDAESARLAARALAAGRPTAWFEELYAPGARAEITMPWDRAHPSALLKEWLTGSGAGRSAVVVGCGLGADAEFVAAHGFATTAFDVSATAVRTARQRYPTAPVDYCTADLLALPDGWAFDLVVEIINVQALPVSLRAAAVAAVAGRWSRRAARCWPSRTCAPGRFQSARRGPSPGRRSRRSPSTGSSRWRSSRSTTGSPVGGPSS